MQAYALVEENVPSEHALHSLSFVLLAFAEMKLPALQLRQVVQAYAFVDENVPSEHALHSLSFILLAFAEIKVPALQFLHCEQVSWLDPVEKVCGPHEEHALSEAEDPAVLTKVPPPQTVQGVHLGLGGRLDSDTLPK